MKLALLIQYSTGYSTSSHCQDPVAHLLVVWIALSEPAEPFHASRHHCLAVMLAWLCGDTAAMLLSIDANCHP